MALPMRSPPTSPPLAKRARLDPDEAFSALPPSPSISSSPNKATSNGHTHGLNNGDAPPIATSAPAPANLQKSAIDAAGSDDEEGEEPVPVTSVAEEEDLARRDMYLDTVSFNLMQCSSSARLTASQISRQSLDFDFERLCSKSLSNINVYACLICGKYFQGRGRGSWAYRHAVGENHRVWLNLETEKACTSDEIDG